MYRHVCGLQPSEQAPGFKRFAVKPEIYGKLRFAKTRLRSAAGTIESGWSREPDGDIVVTVRVPFDAEATVYLPDADAGRLNAPGYNATQEGSKAKIELLAGRHAFRYRPTKEYALRYSVETPLSELADNPETLAVLTDMFPQFVEMRDRSPEPVYSIATMPPMLLRMAFGEVDLGLLDERLGKVEYKNFHDTNLTNV